MARYNRDDCDDNERIDFADPGGNSALRAASNVREWEAIDKFFADCDPTSIGKIFKEYVEESQHAGWDGFTPQHLNGVHQMLTDFILYYKNSR